MKNLEQNIKIKVADVNDVGAVCHVLRKTWKNTYSYIFDEKTLNKISGIWHSDNINGK
jgi:hypothetical protein